MKRVLLWTAGILLLLTFTYGTHGLLRPTKHIYEAGKVSVPVVNLAWNGPSASGIQEIIDNEGGLPKRLEQLTAYRQPDGTPTLGLLNRVAGYTVWVTPVKDFEIVRTTVNGGDILALTRRGELAYTVAMDFRVHYADGDTAVLRWSAWGYGFALGPLVGPKRDGPAGELNVLERSWGY